MSEGADTSRMTRFSDQPPDISQSTRDLLEQYSHIPADEVEKHLYEIRSLAYSIHPYPCIGQWRFLDLSISSSPQYNHVLTQLTDHGATLLDLGCCFGQDIRKLIFDGAPPANLVASDLRNSFWDLGYDLFRDKDRLISRFLAGDVLEGGSLRELDGTIDIIHASSFFHLFSWAEQVRAGVRCTALLKQGKTGALVFGRQIGSQWPGVDPRRAAEGRDVWRHDGDSWQRLWDEIGRETGTRWRTEVSMEKRPGLGDARLDEKGTGAGGGEADTEDRTGMVNYRMRFACWME